MFKPVKVTTDVLNIMTVTTSSEKFFLTVVKPDSVPLPREVSALIPKLVTELNSGKSVIDFGDDVQTRVSQFADKMLDNVGMTNIGEFQRPLTDVLVLCSTVNASSIQSGKLNSRIPFYNRFRLFFATTKAKAVSNINSVREQIDDVMKEVVKKEAVFRKNIDVLEEMYMLNMQEYYALQAHILAIEQVMLKKSDELKMFATQNQGSTDPLIGLEISNRQDFITALDKKLYDFRAISMSCLNSAPMIRNEQKASSNLIEKFRSIRTLAIPYWKKQAALLISSIENQSGASLGTKIADTTNQMTITHADAVAKNVVDTARLNERGVIDVTTLEYATNSVVTSINEMLQIADQGKQYRLDANQKIQGLKLSLNQNVVQRGMS